MTLSYRGRVLEALVEQLSKIRVADGWGTDVGQVVKRGLRESPEDSEDLFVHPLGVLVTLRNGNRGPEAATGVYTYLAVELHAWITAAALEGREAWTMLDLVCTDLEVAAKVDEQLAGLAQQTTIQGFRYEQDAEAQGVWWVVVELQVQFLHDRQDPRTRGEVAW